LDSFEHWRHTRDLVASNRTIILGAYEREHDFDAIEKLYFESDDVVETCVVFAKITEIAHEAASTVIAEYDLGKFIMLLYDGDFYATAEAEAGTDFNVQ
jgi:hypothetical protein